MKFLNRPIAIQFIVFYIILITYTIGLSFLTEGNICPSANDKKSVSSFDEIFLKYSIGAIFETITGSFLVILILRLFKFFRERFYTLVFVSAIPFALLHYECVYYVLFAYIGGVVFNLFYLSIYKKMDSHPISIGLVSMLHFLVNVTTYITAMLLGKI